ncbi:hypothetical protein, conserved [Eimeria necatrix]|uniref:CS domain-containing protein n=1 Tax=Eimeria necatrix TaxID=51315 RepID=U6MPG4_9EIME|nr:hypothetical protein, conserved [Eimeria necatrix]CDJ66087.1 hypothetical protein, conserved [Eimeria necatrix]
MANEDTQATAAEEATGSEIERKESALRSSIAKYGSNSYYYAHAPLPAAGEDAKKIEGPGIVTGGSPTLLASGRAEPQPLPNAAEAAAAAVAGRRLGGALSLTRYTWGDSTKTVKVYIHLDAIRPGEEADGPFSPDKVAAEFDKNKFAVALERPSGLYILAIMKTYGSLVPSESSITVNENRICISLKKEEEGLTWFNLSTD